jgi:hypothetical protein
MLRFWLLLGVLSFSCLSIGCGKQTGDITESASESDIEEYERMLAETEADDGGE